MGGGGLEVREGRHWTPKANFKRLVNRNTIKPKLGRPPWQFFLEALPPPHPAGFWQKFKIPSPLDFRLVCISAVLINFYLNKLADTRSMKTTKRKQSHHFLLICLATRYVNMFDGWTKYIKTMMLAKRGRNKTTKIIQNTIYIFQFNWTNWTEEKRRRVIGNFLIEKSILRKYSYLEMLLHY